MAWRVKVKPKNILPNNFCIYDTYQDKLQSTPSTIAGCIFSSFMPHIWNSGIFDEHVGAVCDVVGQEVIPQISDIVKVIPPSAFVEIPE
jgi:hypothetical protein